MKIYCPNCFWPNDENEKFCIRCGSQIDWKEASYKSKLISALSHKRADIVMLSAKILSNYPSAETEKALIKLLKSANDPYIQAVAAETLGKIGSRQSLKTLKAISESGSVISREKAIKAIGEIKKRIE